MPGIWPTLFTIASLATTAIAQTQAGFVVMCSAPSDGASRTEPWVEVDGPFATMDECQAAAAEHVDDHFSGEIFETRCRQKG